MGDSGGESATVTFVTGNEKKWIEVQAILGDSIKTRREGIECTRADMAVRRVRIVPEIQGSSIEEIAMFKCREAAKIVNGPVIVEDVALCFEALNGLPGPYIKWFVQGVGLDGINSMLSGFPNKGAEAVCTFAYVSGPNVEPVLLQGRAHGQIVPPRGPHNFGWDPIFQPDHPSGLTYAEMSAEMKNSSSHRRLALQKLQAHFAECPRPC